MERGIKLTNVSKAFCVDQKTVPVFRNLNLMLALSHTTAIVGPSGCGKSTLLNMISQLSRPDAGSIEFQDGQGTARIGYMLQDPILLPWRTLAENAGLGAEVVRRRSHINGERLDEYFSKFGLPKEAYPAQASGGMNQRAALIRTLLIEPAVLLLDEPFSNLDFDIKLKVQRTLLEYKLDYHATVILVTHDIEDAIALSDTIIVMSDKPAVVKVALSVDLGLRRKDPVDARTSPRFGAYFAEVWEHIKAAGRPAPRQRGGGPQSGVMENSRPLLD